MFFRLEALTVNFSGGSRGVACSRTHIGRQVSVLYDTLLLKGINDQSFTGILTKSFIPFVGL